MGSAWARSERTLHTALKQGSSREGGPFSNSNPGPPLIQCATMEELKIARRRDWIEKRIMINENMVNRSQAEESLKKEKGYELKILHSGEKKLRIKALKEDSKALEIEEQHWSTNNAKAKTTKNPDIVDGCQMNDENIKKNPKHMIGRAPDDNAMYPEVEEERRSRNSKETDLSFESDAFVYVSGTVTL